jgi:hypothetical protein
MGMVQNGADWRLNARKHSTKRLDFRKIELSA